MLLFAAIFSIGLTSCGDGEEETKPTPSVSFKTSQGLVSSNTTLEAGSTFNYGIIANGVEDLTKVRVTLSVDGGSSSILIDSVLDEKTFDANYSHTLGGLAGTEVITATVTMANGETNAVSMVITKSPKSVAVSSPRITQLGNQNNASKGSFLDIDLTSFDVYTLSEANANPALVKMFYYYGTNNRATLSAATDAQATQIFASISSWSTKVNTQFRRTSLNKAAFDAITNSSQIDPEFVGKTDFSTKATLLQAGEVIAFKVDGGIYGLIYINAVVGTNTGSGELDIIVKFPGWYLDN